MGVLILEHDVRSHAFVPLCLPKPNMGFITVNSYLLGWGIEAAFQNGTSRALQARKSI